MKNISSVERHINTNLITYVLESLSHYPIKILGDEFYYSHIFGDKSNNKNTLKVNNRLNSWFDSQLQSGGTLIDLLQKLWPGINTNEIVSKLEKLLINVPIQKTLNRKIRKRRPVRIPDYKIKKTLPLGYNTEITEYLKDMGLWSVADINLREVYYYTSDQKGNVKQFCAGGWQNENSGWEVLARNFKGCIGNKGITFLERSSLTGAIFGNYIDYIKRPQNSIPPHASILLLNHPDNFYTIVNRAKHFNRLYLCMANDQFNGTIINEFYSALPNIIYLKS